MYKILLVDDDRAMRFIYSKMKAWSQCGFEISMEATNGKEALEILQTKSFDLVVTDIRMPFVDGIELLRTIKERNIDTCLIFISSYNDFEYARQGLILGAFDYVLKPTKEPQLIEVLQRAKTHLDEKYSNVKINQGVLNVLQAINLRDDTAFIHKVCLYFTENYGKLVTMETLSEYFAFNKDYFGKVFKQNTNVSFNYFNSLIKVEYAKDLIRTENYKNYEISEILGYSSVDYFTRVFKDITGETPSQYKSHV